MMLRLRLDLHRGLRLGRPVSFAVVVGGLASLSGCTVPITSQTITSGALNAGALLFVDRHNNEGEDAYRYRARVDADALTETFEAALAEANHDYLFPAAGRDPDRAAAAWRTSDSGHSAEAGRTSDSERTSDSGRTSETRRTSASTASRIPDRQWTPAPLYDIEPGSPKARGDTLVWIVTHRATRRVAFLLVPRRGGTATEVVIAPYEPPADALLSVPSDHAQRNAVEALHQTFYMAAVARFGPGVFVDGPEADGSGAGDAVAEVSLTDDTPEADAGNGP